MNQKNILKLIFLKFIVFNKYNNLYLIMKQKLLYEQEKSFHLKK